MTLKVFLKVLKVSLKVSALEGGFQRHSEFTFASVLPFADRPLHIGMITESSMDCVGRTFLYHLSKLQFLQPSLTSFLSSIHPFTLSVNING